MPLGGGITKLSQLIIDAIKNWQGENITNLGAGAHDVNAKLNSLVGGDGTAGRILRGSRLMVKDGTNANTLKCELTSRWNGDIIAETNNIAKGGTTGFFTLDINGFILKIENAGLSGNVLYEFTVITANTAATNVTCFGQAVGNDLQFGFQLKPSSVGWEDMTAIVDVGKEIHIEIIYVTDA